jgi:hypothetical protein
VVGDGFNALTAFSRAPAGLVVETDASLSVDSLKHGDHRLDGAVHPRDRESSDLAGHVPIEMRNDEGGSCGRVDVFTLEQVEHFHESFGDHAAVGCADIFGKVRLATTTVLPTTPDNDRSFDRANVGEGDSLASGDAVYDLGANFFRSRLRGKSVEDGGRKFRTVRNLRRHVPGHVHEAGRRIFAHPKLTLDPRQEIAMPDAIFDRDQLAADLNDVLRGAGHPLANAAGESTKELIVGLPELAYGYVLCNARTFRHGGFALSSEGPIISFLFLVSNRRSPGFSTERCAPNAKYKL